MPTYRTLAGAATILFLALGRPAVAQIDLTEVEVQVDIQHLDAVGTSFTAQLVVRGTGISRARITPPMLPPQNLTQQPSGDFLLELSFPDRASLDLAVPDGSYLLELDDGQVTATLPYVRPAVPNPSITAPVHRSVVPAGPVEVRFAACTICNQANDATLGTLSQGGTILAQETLAPAASVWTPDDGSGPVSLPPNASFRADIAHTAWRSSPLTTDDSDDFLFQHSFSQSDAVDFDSGFAAPQGRFCILVNGDPTLEPGPADGCTTLVRATELEVGILDTGGSLCRRLAGMDVRIDFAVSAGGRIAGVADVDVDGDGGGTCTGSFEASAPVSGRLKGKRGRLKQKLALRVQSTVPGAEADLRIRILERSDLATGVRTRDEQVKGRLRGARIVERVSSADSILGVPLGWRLDFDLGGAGGDVSQAILRLAGGRSIPLSANGTFHFDQGFTNLRFGSAGADLGVRIKLQKLTLDDAGAVVRGRVRLKALGQKGVLELP